MKTAIDDVHDFMKQNDQVVSILPTAYPDQETYRLRLKLINEECNELLEAMSRRKIVEIADAIADSLYVIIGTALAYGIPLEEIWGAVHHNNMTKFGKDADGKVVKQGGYVPVDLRPILFPEEGAGSESNDDTD